MDPVPRDTGSFLNFYNMKLLLSSLFAIITFSLFTFSVQNCNAGKEHTYAYRYLLKYPKALKIINGDSSYFYENDTISVLHKKDSIFYFFTNVVQFETGAALLHSNPFFLQHKNSAQGLYFDNRLSEGRMAVAESILKQKFPRGEEMNIPPPEFYTKHSDVAVTRDISRERYYLTRFENRANYDSVELEYNRSMNDVDFTFSKKLDSLKKSKLTRIRLVYNKGQRDDTGQSYPASEYLFEIQSYNKRETDSLFRIVNALKRPGRTDQ